MINKLSFIQIGILILILIISYFTFSYLNKNKVVGSIHQKKPQDVEIKIQKKVEDKSQQSNQILDLSYKSSDERGNTYEINSLSGSIDDENENILILEKVTAEILIVNYGTFFVKSNKAKYNKLNLDTHFFGNVNLFYLEHNIESEDLFLKYIDKDVKISNNVKYVYNNNLLEADEIYFDLVNKSSKIYMKDKTQKVKAIFKN